MTSRVLRYLLVALATLALVASVAGGSADAKKKRGVGKSVDSSEIEDGTIVCADIAAAVFPNGCPDDDSGAAPAPGGGGSAAGQNLNAVLLGSQTKSVSSDTFTISQSTDAAGACQNWLIVSSFGTAYVGASGQAGPFAQLSGVSTPFAAANTADFVAASAGLDASKNVSAIVASVDIGGQCQTSGDVF